MIRTLIITALFLCTTFKSAHTQSVSVSWLKNSIGSNWVTVNDIDLFEDSTIYLTGNYSDTIEFDHEKSYGYRDGYIAKYDLSGNCIWMKFIKNMDDCYIENLTVSQEGNIYLSGYFKGELSMDKQSIKSINQKNAFFACIQPDGNTKWVRSIYGDLIEEINLSQVNNEHLYFAINFSNEILVNDTNYFSVHGTDVLLGVIDKNGDILKTTIIKGQGNENVADIIVDEYGFVYLTGSFEDELYIQEESIFSKGLNDVFFIKVNNELIPQIIWSIGGIYNDFGKTISLDSKNNIILSGNFSGKLELEQLSDYIESNGMLDVFICQFDNQGKLNWVDSFGGNANEYVASVAISTFNDIYISGTFRGTIEKSKLKIFSTGFSSDVFLAKYSSFGELKYIESFGDNKHDFSNKIIINKSNDIFLTGNFNSLFRIHNDTSRLASNWEYFISKLYDCEHNPKISLPNDTSLCNESILITADSSFKQYYWNNTLGNNTYTIDTSGFFILEVIDKNGCQSRDSIAVQIYNLPVVDLGNDTIINKGDSIRLNAGSDYTTYSWNTLDTTSSIMINTSNFSEGKYLFSVSVVDTSLCRNSDSINIILQSSQQGLQTNTRVFPNPFEDFVWLQFTGIDEPIRIQIQLISTEGAIQISNEILVENNYFKKKINTKFLNQGEYYLRIRSKSINKVFKLLKI